MSPSRPSALGLLILVVVVVVVVTGCEDEAVSAEPVPTDAAVVAYAAPAGAPSFCSTLVASTRIAGIPQAVGALAAESGTVEARLQLTGGIDDLQAALDEVRADGHHERLGSALEHLIVTLTDAMRSPLGDSAGTDISAALDAVGHQAQPTCRFPS